MIRKIQSHSKYKPMEDKRTTSNMSFLKTLFKPMTNATILGFITVLIMSLYAFGVLALSKCGGTLHVQLNPFNLELTKGSCSTLTDH
jgi:hypothetical protein